MLLQIKFFKETLWYSGVNVFIYQYVQWLVFVFSHNLPGVCHRGSTVCEYRTLCRNIKLNLFETTMSFPTQGWKHLNKLLPLDMDLFNIRSFQCYRNCTFTISSVRNNIVWGILHLGTCLIPTERRSALWALSKPSQQDHLETREVSFGSLEICAPTKNWWTSKAEKNHLTSLSSLLCLIWCCIHLLWNMWSV